MTSWKNFRDNEKYGECKIDAPSSANKQHIEHYFLLSILAFYDTSTTLSATVIIVQRDNTNLCL
jgi:hypothetical protein